MAIGGKEKNGVVLSISMDNFNSTTMLTDKKSEAGDIDDYDPFDNREVEHPNTDVGALVHLLKSSLGTGIMAMPNAIKHAGLIFGLIATLVVGFICTHCVHMLVNSSHILCRREKIPSLGFAETAEAAFRSGSPKMRPWAITVRKCVNVALISTYYSALCVYIVFIASSIQPVIEKNFSDFRVNVRVYIAMILVPLCILGLIRNLKYLVPFSALANLFLLSGLLITLYYTFVDIPSPTEKWGLKKASDLPTYFSTVIFAMEGIGVVMPLENTMKNPRRFLGCPGVLNIGMSVVVALYALVGCFGYLKYGEDTASSITFNLGTDKIMGQVVQLLLAVAIFFSYGLQFFIPTSITWPMIEEHLKDKWKLPAEIGFRLLTVIITVSVAAAVPNLGPIIELVGAICFSTLGLLCPAMIDTATHWEHGLGRYRWRLWKNCAIIVFALIALAVGSYTSILAIIDTYSPDR